MTTYAITPLDLGRTRREKSFFTYMTDVGEAIDLAVVSFLVQGGGHTILVDTGGPPPSATAPWHQPYDQTPEQRLVTQLARHGLDPSDVDIVIFTHLHWDHCYNVEFFRRAHFFVRRRELEFAKNPCPIYERMYDVPSTGVSPPYLNLDFHFTTDDQEIVPGLRVVPTPGHSPGHQSVAVETAEGLCVIAGDLVPLYENWERRIPSGMLTDLEEWYESFARLQQLGGTLLASHDLRTLQRLVPSPRR